MEILDLQRVYTTERGNYSKYFTGLIISDLKEVTVRRGFEADILQVRKGMTMFNEIGLRPIERNIPKSFRGLMSIPFSTEKMSPDKFARKFIALLEVAIYKNWDPKKIHVILHSGGWDSRILSYILTDMCKKYGQKWFGDTFFVCKEPESDFFYQVMSFEGWGQDRTFVYNENENPLEYNAKMLDFDNLWKLTNDAVWPCNFIRETLTELVNNRRLKFYEYDRGMEVDDFQIFGAGYFTEMFLFKARFNIILDYYYKPVTNSQYSTSGNILYPILTPEIFRLFISADYGKVEHLKLKEIVMNTLNPELVKIPRHDDLKIYESPYMRISDRLLKYVEEKYYGSWYGKEIAPEVKFINSYRPSPAWCHYSAAAICDHLIKVGVKVK